MMSTNFRWAAMFALVLFVSGCAAGGQRPAELQAGSDTPVVEVTNHNWSDVVVYAVRETGSRVRLGMVTSMGTQALRLPRGLVNSIGGIRLVASPIASSSQFQTEPMNVWPGQTIELRIENQLGISTVQVW
jgi:hypothetical protein